MTIISSHVRVAALVADRQPAAERDLLGELVADGFRRGERRFQLRTLKQAEHRTSLGNLDAGP
jgi:hypothetical protein